MSALVASTADLVDVSSGSLQQADLKDVSSGDDFWEISAEETRAVQVVTSSRRRLACIATSVAAGYSWAWTAAPDSVRVSHPHSYGNVPGKRCQACSSVYKVPGNCLPLFSLLLLQCVTSMLHATHDLRWINSLQCGLHAHPTLSFQGNRSGAIHIS
jgi:hypothetical protein